MTDEILIHKYLEKNYKVTTSISDFNVLDLLDEKTLTPHDFIRTFGTIFGNFTTTDNETSTQIFYRWFNIKKRLIAKELIDYLENMDGTRGSGMCLNECLRHFKGNETFGEAFVTNNFNSYYNEKFIMPKVSEYVKQVNLEKGSKLMIDEFIESLNDETFIQKDKATKALHDWYSEKVIGDKVRSFLTQLVMTLGKRNWQVTWIGHGPITRNQFLSQFKDESDFHHDFIMMTYDDWYDTKVIEASERMMLRSSSGVAPYPNTSIGYII